MNPADFRRRLDTAMDAAPPQPMPDDDLAAGKTLLRHRRRTTGAWMAGSASVLGIALLAGVLNLGPAEKPPAPPTTSGPSPATSDDPGLVPDCRPPARAEVEGSPAVPSGAVAARLCGGLIDNGGFNTYWPADVLEGTTVNRLEERLNTLRPFVQPNFCEAIGGVGYELVLAYPDGTEVSLIGTTAGNCANIQVEGGQAWRGGPQMLDLALKLIDEQREASAPAATIQPPDCPNEWQDVGSTAGAHPVDPQDAVAVTACRYLLQLDRRRFIDQSADGRLRSQRSVAAAAPLLRMITQGSTVDPCDGHDYNLDPVQDVLLVRDQNGDSHVISTTRCERNELTGHRLYPSEDLKAAVAGVLDR